LPIVSFEACILDSTECKYGGIKVVLHPLAFFFFFSSPFTRTVLLSIARFSKYVPILSGTAHSILTIDINMAPTTPLTPPSSGSEASSPLAARQANVSKKRRSRKPSTGKFTWKTNHRRTLLVCRRRSMPSQDIAKVFNTLYSEEWYRPGESQRAVARAQEINL
jgi:hypothetical protein